MQTLIDQIIDTYSGSNLMEDLKLSLAQSVVNRCDNVKEAVAILGMKQTTINGWFRNGWLVRPSHYKHSRDTRFQKGEMKDPDFESKRLASLKAYLKGKKHGNNQQCNEQPT